MGGGAFLGKSIMIMMMPSYCEVFGSSTNQPTAHTQPPALPAIRPCPLICRCTGGPDGLGNNQQKTTTPTTVPAGVESLVLVGKARGVTPAGRLGEQVLRPAAAVRPQVDRKSVV